MVGMKINSLLQSLDPSGMFELDVDAEEQLLSIANDFASSLIKKSTRLAKHRCTKKGSSSLNVVKRVEVEDVALVLKKNWGIKVPGLSDLDEERSGFDVGRMFGSSGKKVTSSASTLNNGKRNWMEVDCKSDKGPQMKKIDTSM